MNGTTVLFERKGKFPMPLDVEVVYAGNLVEHYNIPLVSMYGAKKDPKYDVLNPWPWTHPTYEFKIPSKGKEVIEVKIDPTLRLLDIDTTNNSWKK